MGEESLLGNGRLQYQAGRLPQCGLMLWHMQTKGKRNERSNTKKNCQEISGSMTTCEETGEAKDEAKFGRGRMVMLLTRQKEWERNKFWVERCGKDKALLLSIRNTPNTPLYLCCLRKRDQLSDFLLLFFFLVFF